MTALRRDDHHQHAEQHDRQGEGEVLARQRVDVAGDAQHHDLGEGDQRQAAKHGRADADDVLDFAVNAELGDDAMQRDRDDDRLESEARSAR